MKTHYDVLNLHKNCTAKEIKDSFIKLSKLYHPDINKTTDAHKKFVEVNEAYSVLGKPETRSQYDNRLMSVRSSGPYRPSPTHSTQNPTTIYRTPYDYYAYMYANNLRRNQENSTAFITTRKLSLLFFCCLLVMMGSGIQMKAIMKRKRRQDQELAKYLKECRERKKNKREEKLKEADLLNNTPNVGN